MVFKEMWCSMRSKELARSWRHSQSLQDTHSSLDWLLIIMQMSHSQPTELRLQGDQAHSNPPSNLQTPASNNPKGLSTLAIAIYYKKKSNKRSKPLRLLSGCPLRRPPLFLRQVRQYRQTESAYTSNILTQRNNRSNVANSCCSPSPFLVKIVTPPRQIKMKISRAQLFSAVHNTHNVTAFLGTLGGRNSFFLLSFIFFFLPITHV